MSTSLGARLLSGDCWDDYAFYRELDRNRGAHIDLALQILTEEESVVTKEQLMHTALKI